MQRFLRACPDAISNLRRATNYLTPLKGLLSPDTWATITIVGRKLLLNHLVIVPLIAALLLIVKFFGATAHDDTLICSLGKMDQPPNWSLRCFAGLTPEYLGSLLLAGVFVAFGWIIFSIARPSWDVRRPSPLINTIPPSSTPYCESLAQIWAPRLGIAFVLFGAFIFALAGCERHSTRASPFILELAALRDISDCWRGRCVCRLCAGFWCGNC